MTHVHRDRTDPARGAGGHCTWSMRDADGTWRVALADRATQTPTSAGGTIARITTLPASAATRCSASANVRATSTAPARASRCATSTRWATARSTPTRCKHIPFYITWSPAACQGFGLFYDTLSDCAFDMGRETDNYHGPYRYFVAEHGDLDYYFIASPDTPLARALHLAHRRPRARRNGAGYSADDALHRCAGRAAADEPVRRTMRHARHPSDSFHLSSAIHRSARSATCSTGTATSFPTRRAS